MSIPAEANGGTGAALASLALERLVRSPNLLVENLPIGIFTCDCDGRLVQFNRQAAALWDRAPTLGESPDVYGGAVAVLDISGARVGFGDAPTGRALATGQAVRDCELLLEYRNGERAAILVNCDPVVDEQGRRIGAVSCFQDITELKRMRQRAREDRRVARSVLEALPAAIYTTDADGKLLYFNKAAEALWGFAPPLGEQRWCGSWKIFAPDGAPVPHDTCPMAVAIKGRRAAIGPEAVAERPDGTRVPFMPHPTPIFDGGGALIGAVNMLIDLTPQKTADTQQRGLIDEINHRVKNTLATIQALAAQTMRGDADAAGRRFEDRLRALSRVHDELARHVWEWADLKVIADDTFAALRKAPGGVVRVQGPSVRLAPRAALAIGMVLHELADNATRHGALSVPGGEVSLEWRAAHGRLHIDWRERGGPAVGAAGKQGFGVRLLNRSIAQELGGQSQIAFHGDGVHCTMEIPLAG
ncbi:MAG TPA: HWE histidine kinase domain-containing protein [Rhizomicrobium sp.]